MRYGVISDIHGNLEAFRAVLDALDGEMIDSYLFVGDLIGYGADPKECIRVLRDLNPAVMVAGNHEWGLLGKMEESYFNELAQRAVTWTKKLLNDDEIKYLESFPLIYEDEKMTLVHGTLNSPEEFYYVFDTEDAYVTMSQMKNCLCFIGHSHVPGIFVSDESKVIYLEDTDVRVDNQRKYLVNVGSVGQPRDGDPRASYAVYDEEELTIQIKRVDYDVQKAQEKILKAGLPPKLAYRLSEGR